MQNIWITYAEIGHGHKSAALALKRQLEDRGIKVKTFDSTRYANPFVFGILVFLVVGIQKHCPRLYNFFYQKAVKPKPTKDLFTKFAVRLAATKKFVKLVQKEKPSLIISTNFINTWQITYLKSHELYDVPVISICTDYIVFNWFLTDAKFIDFFIVADEKSKKEIISRGVSAAKVKDYGIPVSSKFTPRPKQPGPRLKILFFGGGGLGHEGSLPYLKALQGSSELEIKFVSGKSRKLYQKAKKIASENTQVIGFSSDVPQLLAWADLAISKAGGISTAECINAGTPLVSILSSVAHEHENVKYVVSKNVGKWCDSPASLQTTIAHLAKDRNDLAAMQQNCRSAAKPAAADNVAKLASSILSGQKFTSSI